MLLFKRFNRYKILFISDKMTPICLHLIQTLPKPLK